MSDDGKILPSQKVEAMEPTKMESWNFLGDSFFGKHTLQGTNPYPTKREKEPNHRLKSALFGWMC